MSLDASDEAWQLLKHRNIELTERAERRVTDLHELHSAVCDQLTLLDARESDAARQVHTVCDAMVRQLRQRESELLLLLHEDAALERTQLTHTRDRLESHVKAMLDAKATLEAHHAEDTQRQVEVLLRDSAYFDLPDAQLYGITTQPLVVERYVTLVKERAHAMLPSALTIPIAADSVHIPLTRSDPHARSHRGLHIQKGIFHYIATAGMTRPFRNPIEADAIRVRCTVPLVVGALSSLCDDPNSLTPKPLRTASNEETRVEVDFGTRRWVDCTAYAIRHGHHTEHAALRAWRLLGSRDGTRWILLDAQRRNHTLGRAPFNVAYFEIDREEVLAQVPDRNHWSSAAQCAFRYFALELAGADAVGEHHMELSGLELYGHLMDTAAV